MDISLQAKKYIKELAKTGELYKKFASEEKYKAFPRPVSFFMAGSPGAGKTETSKYIINLVENYMLEENNLYYPIVRIDPDEIRELCPGYNGENAHLFQKAASLGVDKLFDYVNKKKFNALIDGTFAGSRGKLNIERCLKRNRKVHLFYVYQEPKRAWEFVKKREEIEKRKITKETFINSFLSAKRNVEEAKEVFKDKIVLNLITKDYFNNIKEVFLNINNIDHYLYINYNKHDTLKESNVKYMAKDKKKKVFSYSDLSEEEQKHILEQAAEKANEEQRRLVEEYDRKINSENNKTAK